MWCVWIDEQFEWLCIACEKHTHTHLTGNPTIDTCFDADRLDLGRVGILPHPAKMATVYGAKLAQKLQEEKVSPYHVREWLSKLEVWICFFWNNYFIDNFRKSFSSSFSWRNFGEFLFKIFIRDLFDTSVFK